MPEFTPAFIAELLRYAMALVAIAAILWAVSAFMKGRRESQPLRKLFTCRLWALGFRLWA